MECKICDKRKKKTQEGLKGIKGRRERRREKKKGLKGFTRVLDPRLDRIILFFSFHREVIFVSPLSLSCGSSC